MTTQTAVILSSSGPDDLASVEPLLVDLFRDREIVRRARRTPALDRASLAKCTALRYAITFGESAADRLNCALLASRRPALEDRLIFGRDCDAAFASSSRYVSRPSADEHWKHHRSGHSTDGDR